MSLLYWLPLINDVHNQGLTNTTFTSNNITFANNGKLGKSASFNGSNSAIYTDGVSVGNQWTACFWAKMNNAGMYGLFHLGKSASYASSQFYIHTASDNTKQFYRICNGDSWKATMDVDYTTWVHYCMTYDGNKCIIYINGTKLVEQTVTNALISGTRLSIGSYYSSTLYANGMIQDVRLYDNALSPREVKEISKGLVLHYPLSLGGGENIFKNSFNVFDSNPGRLSSTTIYNGLILNDNAPGGRYRSLDIKAENNANRGFYYLYNQTNGSLNLTENEIYTVSFYIRCSKQKNMMVAPVAESQTIITYDSALYSGAANNIIVNSTWQKHYVTFKYTNTTKITTCFYLRALDEDVTFDVALPKLEKGDKPTPWIPNSADSEYSIMGYNDPIEFDVSGYGNNGTKRGTFTYSSDTPRYFTSTVFENNYIVAGRIPIKDELTYSWWAYSDNWGSSLGGSMVSSIESGGMGHQNRLNFACGTGTTSNNYGRLYSMPTPSAGWHMFTETWDGYSFKVYLDGELKNTNTRYTEKTPVFYNANYNVLFIGGESSTSQTVAADRFIGKLSDVRVYATALSAEDIQLLYNATISLSNSGTLLTQGELSEV